MKATTLQLAAAATFKAFIDAHPEEQAWLSEWAAVDLAAPPTRGSEKCSSPLDDRR